MISTATRKPRIRVSILTAAAALGLFALACDTPIPQSPGELEPRTRSQAVVVPEAEVGPDVGVGLEAEFGYVDEDGTFQGLKLDPKVEAQVRATLERAKRVRETLGERLQAGEIKKGMIPGDETVLRDLWLRLGTVTDHLEELSGPELKEKTTTELAMEVRRLHAAFEAGEVTPEEAQRMFRTHMEARRVRLRLPDRPH